MIVGGCPTDCLPTGGPGNWYPLGMTAAFDAPNLDRSSALVTVTASTESATCSLERSPEERIPPSFYVGAIFSHERAGRSRSIDGELGKELLILQVVKVDDDLTLQARSERDVRFSSIHPDQVVTRCSPIRERVAKRGVIATEELEGTRPVKAHSIRRTPLYPGLVRGPTSRRLTGASGGTTAGRSAEASDEEVDVAQSSEGRKRAQDPDPRASICGPWEPATDQYDLHLAVSPRRIATPRDHRGRPSRLIVAIVRCRSG